jgi:predicted naringenin-chalcone synthase
MPSRNSGGAKVIQAPETTLALNQGALEHERQVIAEYGNMSSPTVQPRAPVVKQPSD